MKNFKSYGDKLRDPRWQRKRLKIYERDNFTCTVCGDDTTELQVHHLTYFPGIEPWDYPDKDLVTLCRKSHEQELKRDKWEDDLLLTLRAVGVPAYEIQALAQYLRLFPGMVIELRRMINNAINLGL